jgi:hypothetical protein
MLFYIEIVGESRYSDHCLWYVADEHPYATGFAHPQFTQSLIFSAALCYSVLVLVPFISDHRTAGEATDWKYRVHNVLSWIS